VRFCYLQVRSVLRAVEGNSKGDFDKSSLSGSYASAGRADGFQSRSIGVKKFDGSGNVIRFVRINTNDGECGRRLLALTSEGTYGVDQDGVCVIYYVNLFAHDLQSKMTYDSVIRKIYRC